MMEYLFNFIDLFSESAPWLLLGLLMAGFMKWLIPIELLNKHMGDNQVTSVIKAAVIGAPLPLCSCGVIPAAIGLRRSGASKPATVSFLVATPETGVDSISVSYALLGPFFAIIRPAAAIFTAIYAGIMVKLFALNHLDTLKPNSKAEIKSPLNCCSSSENENNTKVPDAPFPETSLESCHVTEKSVEHEKYSKHIDSQNHEDSTPPPQKVKLTTLLRNSINFSTGKLLSDITMWLLIGLLLAAAIKTWLPSEFLTQWGDGFIAMVAMAIIGIPMYICATASTPIAAGFLATGLSPGAVLVFMLAGPATNIATMGMIKQEMGTRVLLAYLFSIISASISIGYLTNWLIKEFGFSVTIVASHEHVMSDSIVYPLSAMLLAGLIIRNWLKTKNI